MAGSTFGAGCVSCAGSAGCSKGSWGSCITFPQAPSGAYERNLREPTLELLLQLSEYFGVSVDYLLCRTEERLTAKEYKEKDSYELAEFMSGHTITVGGVVVSPADKRRICDMATGLF